MVDIDSSNYDEARSRGYFLNNAKTIKWCNYFKYFYYSFLRKFKLIKGTEQDRLLIIQIKMQLIGGILKWIML